MMAGLLDESQDFPISSRNSLRMIVVVLMAALATMPGYAFLAFPKYEPLNFFWNFSTRPAVSTNFCFPV